MILKPKRFRFRWSWRSLFGLASVGAMLAALLAASPASAKSLYPGQYFIGTIQGLNGSCLDDWGQSIYPGAPVDAYAQCNNGNAQTWVYLDDTSFRQKLAIGLSASDFNGQGTAYCLDVPGASRTPGTKVEIWPCNGTSAQRWIQEPGGALHYSDPNSNLCLDVPAYQVTPVGASSPIQLQIWTCNGGANQNWSSIAIG